MELVSIIVPIYKVEPYLKRCIESILGQTFEKFELILVDDGSPDKCGEICDDFAKKDKRITVIHKENGGLSDARNSGLKIANGEYIVFIDSDDWVTKDYLECLIENLKKHDCDICECEIVRTTEEKEGALNKASNSVKIYNTEDALKSMIQDQELHQYVWNKMYKKDCIKGILFEVGKTNEDEFWTYQVFGRAKKVVKIPDVLYFYFQRDESIMNSGYSLNRLHALEGKIQRQIYIEKNFPTLSVIAKLNLYKSCVYSGQMVLMYFQGQERKIARQFIDNIRRGNKCTNAEEAKCSGSEKVWIKLTKLSFWGTCRLKNLLGKGF